MASGLGKGLFRIQTSCKPAERWTLSGYFCGNHSKFNIASWTNILKNIGNKLLFD